jgi:DNA polymerase IV
MTSSPPARTILHVDMDAFYAAIEQRDAPELQGKPVIIAHVGPRGVVSTCSYEARVFGVRSAMPTARAQQLCPHGVYIEPRIDHYAAVSKEIFAVLGEITPEIEGLSLDEAFLDITRSLSLLGAPLVIGKWLRETVYARTQLRCSVGIAHNKLLAKMASEFCKPNGLLLLTPDQVHRTLDPLPVGKLYTIGKVASGKLAEIGISTIGQLRLAPASKVRRALGNHCETAQAFAAGIDDRAVQSEHEDKSLSAEHTFADDLSTLDDAYRWLMRLSERVAARVRAHAIKARTITVKLRVPPFETMTRQCTLDDPTDNTDVIFQRARELLQRWWQERRQPRLRLLGVSASQLQSHDSTEAVAPVAAVQGDLFATLATAVTDAIPAANSKRDQLSDAINQRFGAGALKRARGVSGER